ncbi:MAG TPA: FmdB family transcriptional regulator [Acidimicrobiaceae bacterium]|nr:FmdB family transcriptional regulator [Acidimicrobiaceae bacterium]HAQ24013.1 FmdB family transcriptional regulator [Acidimicrobiaceae bacterium]HCV34453.1 FmdB family transcriptional regulator [Acidimicrobiaceae bacterium]
MPTYQYRCQSCFDEFEVRQSFNDEALTICPDEACAGPVSKVFSGVGIAFKGDGFYKNDHGPTSKARQTDTASSSSDSASSSETSPSSDSKKEVGSSTSSSGSDSSGAASSGSNQASTAAAST